MGLIRANNLGQILQAKGDLAGAERHTLRALAIDEKVDSPEHPKVAIRANNLGQILQAKGDLAGAERYTLRALRIFENVYGSNHPMTMSVAESLKSLQTLRQQ